MIVGNPSIFAIESLISVAYERRGALALGYFVIDLSGVQYGVRKPNASWLACSFDAVQKRIAERGKHIAPFAEFGDGRVLADAFLNAIYSPNQESEYSFGMTREDFEDEIYLNNLHWIPDGDEAFDDGSYILQFDVGNRVRLIGFKSENYSSTPEDFADVWISADDYYGILEEWTRRFEEEWQSLPKKQLEPNPKLSGQSS